MSNFIQLVRNEQMKLYAKKATWIMISILALLIVAGGLISRTMDDSITKTYDDNWREELQAEIASVEQEDNPSSIDAAFIDVEKNTYHLENDIKPQSYSAMQFVYDNIGLTMIITLFTIIVTAGILSNEFHWGTIKLLLIRPVSRVKILAAKYTTVLLFAGTLLLFLFVFSWLVGAVLFGVNGMSPTAVVYHFNGYQEVNLLSEIGIGYSLKVVNLLMMATFALMISAIFKSSSMAIGFAIFLMFAGNIVIPFIAKYDWAKYILFANTDLSQHREGAIQLFDGMSLSFSITVLLVYYIVFIIATWWTFTKRDIAGH
ncbi:ABC transporter permease [Paraliobacillus sp. JSM ZJ581]|uniref:ABC transporter permease n=1 Tax=Paraliobacillus sp. JSM ZJ581 TaxID=3342118 RepID=UPI0035A9391E